MQPLGTLTPESARDAFSEQAQALATGGAEILWIETMSDLAEVTAAIEGARSVSDLPLAVSMTFEARGHTMMGVNPLQALETLLKYEPFAVGANCGNGPAEIEGVIETMAAANPGIPLIAKSNAGVPKLVDQSIMYDATPEVMAEHALRARNLGARLIGGCCGSTPAHLRAMQEALSS
jgi:5-methyltetrahydrofolate--homocysteine methyltransferase